MFIPILINLTHYDKNQWLFMYYKYVYHCYSNGWPLIVDEHFTFGTIDDLSTSCQNSWYYELLPKSKLESVLHYRIPSEITEILFEREVSLLGVMLSLQEDRFEPLECFLEDCLVDITKEFDEPIEGFITLEGTVKSLEYLSEKHGIPIIYYALGALRSAVYRDTAFMSYYGIFKGSLECERRYRSFLSEMPQDMRWLNNKELLSLFLNNAYIHYLRIFDIKPERAVTVLGNFTLMPIIFFRSMYGDFEVINEVKRIYKDNYKFRRHPADPYGSTNRVSSEHLDDFNTHIPSFLSILKSERIITAGTNMIFEAMLWGRDSCCKTDVFAASFMCKSNYEPEEHTPVPLSFLNFFCFNFLIPFEYMLDSEYMRWRGTNPTEKEIYERHMKIYLNENKITPRMLELPYGDRLKAFLHARGADIGIAEPLGQRKPYKYCPISFLYEQSGESHSCVNYLVDGKRISSLFRFTKLLSNGKVYFQALPDWKKSAHFPAVRANGKKVWYKWKENVPGPSVDILLPKDTYSLEVIWELKEKNPNTNLQNSIKIAENQELVNNMKNQLNYMTNSISWRITSPLRGFMRILKAICGRNKGL